MLPKRHQHFWSHVKKVVILLVEPYITTPIPACYEIPHGIQKQPKSMHIEFLKFTRCEVIHIFQMLYLLLRGEDSGDLRSPFK
jgi:hypothetical protein